MKKPVLAPPRDLGRVPESELRAIAATVHQDLLEARQRAEEAKAAAAAQAVAAASAPSTNRGGKSDSLSETLIAARLELEDGQIVEIPARRTWGGSSAFIDWVNFTADEKDYWFGMSCLSDEECIDRVSVKCQEIFGFGITRQRDTGANFYKRSYVLGDGYGMVCHGGQRSTVLVLLSGEGCAAAKHGWEQRLYHFLTVQCGNRAKLTRVDCAHDDYDGSTYSVDRADADFDSGKFNCGGRMPNHEYRGNWKRPNGKGRTVYVGNRANGKFCRVYEKGRQLGDKNSEWVRIEVEFKAIDRQIPYEILLEPGQYLAAAYPAFNWISEHQERILTTQKKTEITYAAMLDFAKRQMGAIVNVIATIEGSAERAIEAIRRDAIPGRMKVPMWQLVGECVHEVVRPALPREVADAMWIG